MFDKRFLFLYNVFTVGNEPGKRSGGSMSKFYKETPLTRIAYKYYRRVIDSGLVMAMVKHHECLIIALRGDPVSGSSNAYGTVWVISDPYGRGQRRLHVPVMTGEFDDSELGLFFALVSGLAWAELKPVQTDYEMAFNETFDPRTVRSAVGYYYIVRPNIDDEWVWEHVWPTYIAAKVEEMMHTGERADRVHEFVCYASY
jgi:hypothetical protein